MNLPFWRKKCNECKILALFKLLKSKSVNGGYVKELFQGGWLLCKQQRGNMHVWDFAEWLKEHCSCSVACAWCKRVLNSPRKVSVQVQSRCVSQRSSSSRPERSSGFEDVTYVRAKCPQILKFPKPTKKPYKEQGTVTEKTAVGRHSRWNCAARGVGVVARVADVAADYVVGVIGFRHQVAGIYTHLEGRKHSAVCCKKTPKKPQTSPFPIRLPSECNFQVLHQ